MCRIGQSSRHLHVRLVNTHVSAVTRSLTDSWGRCYHASLVLFLQVLLQQVRPCSPPAPSAPGAHVRTHSRSHEPLSSFDVCTSSFAMLERRFSLFFLSPPSPSSLHPSFQSSSEDTVFIQKIIPASSHQPPQQDIL